MSSSSRSVFIVTAVVGVSAIALAQSSTRAPLLITKAIDESRAVTLAGNTRGSANAANDMGRVADNLPMEHMLLQLQRSPEQEQALEEFLDQLYNPSSPNYHKWLTAAQFGAQFGLAEQDLNTITTWLESKGFTVNSVYPNGTVIDFSGTAGAVRSAFRTEIHNLSVDGESHVANMSDPQIPEALAPAIRGIVSLHDFRPHQMNRPKPQYTFSSGGSTYQAVVPADLATIYNFTPLFTATTAAGTITGKAQTIALIEDANLYSANDWKNFQSTFGLTSYGGTLVEVNPAPATGRNNCRNPGTGNGDDIETAVDAEWALAAAPGATIEVAACASTNTTFGGLIAMQNLLNGNNPPKIMSISYGECEAENGASANAAYNEAYKQAAAAGVSVFVAAGDEGAASCDAGANVATHGIGVSAFASTPYNVAVGGTDFGDTYGGTNSTYWNSTNNSVYGSAKSYIPEIPWNDSCASELIANYYGSTTVSYGANGFCNTRVGKQDFLTVSGGSGGPSGCATGTPSTTGVVSGTCAGYSKPSWQTGITPADAVRDIPDVSLFAANGVWGHFYVICFSDIRNGGSSCKGAPSAWAGAGGTSFSAPIMAGVQALINQKTQSTWGNPNSVYYSMAAGSAYCSSNAPTQGCIFYDVTQGDIDMDCSGTSSCYGSSTTTAAGGWHGRGGQQVIYGALSTSTTSFDLAYPAAPGWDFATGIGTVNVANLVNNWPKRSVTNP